MPRGARCRHQVFQFFVEVLHDDKLRGTADSLTDLSTRNRCPSEETS